MSVAGASSFVEVERRGHVALIWMIDSVRRNALSTTLVSQMLGALRSTRDEGARAVVIASKERAFCAGADIRDMLDSGWLETDSRDAGVTPPDLFEAIENDGRPILAAVDQPAFGGGVELCLACDLVVAAQAASFMLPELTLGVLPNTALARLPHVVGARAAARLILSGAKVDATEALRLDLVSEVVEEPSAVSRAVKLGQDIAERMPPAAFAAAKRNLRRGPTWPEIRAMLGEMDSEEWREGTTAFIEKRRANYERFWQSGNGAATGA